MAKVIKIVLIVLGALTLLGGGCVAAIMYWVESNREEIEAIGAAATAEGESFGADTDAAGCIDEALRRGAECDGVMCEAGTSIFLRSCLHTADVPDDYCDDVPSVDSILDAVRFRTAVCEERVPKEQVKRCTRIVDSIQEYCHMRKAGSD
jgi:hypothetical protein